MESKKKFLAVNHNQTAKPNEINMDVLMAPAKGGVS